jgi:hypothetical protein
MVEPSPHRCPLAALSAVKQGRRQHPEMKTAHCPAVMWEQWLTAKSSHLPESQVGSREPVALELFPEHPAPVPFRLPKTQQLHVNRFLLMAQVKMAEVGQERRQPARPLPFREPEAFPPRTSRQESYPNQLRAD